MCCAGETEQAGWPHVAQLICSSGINGHNPFPSLEGKGTVIDNVDVPVGINWGLFGQRRLVAAVKCGMVAVRWLRTAGIISW